MSRDSKKYLKFVNASKSIGTDNVELTAQKMFYKDKSVTTKNVLDAAAASILVNKLSKEELEVVAEFLTDITGYYNECGLWGNNCVYTKKDLQEASSKDVVVLYKEESDK